MLTTKLIRPYKVKEESKNSTTSYIIFISCVDHTTIFCTLSFPTVCGDSKARKQ